MKNEKTGFTLGKFAPFHKGHESLLNTAASEVDKLIVCVCEDSVTRIPLKTRADWIRDIYAGGNVEVIECYDCPQEVGYTEEIKKSHEDYYIKLLGGRKITHFYTAEHYGGHMSKAFGAADRRIKKDVRISATEIRKNPYRYRKYISDTVYKDLILKAAFLGSECTGKTTLAKEMARRLDTNYMFEYGSDYWFKHQVNGRLAPEQLAEIATGHIEIENELILQSNKYLFVDTNAITTFMFALDYHGYALPELERLAAECKERYDLFFLCCDDFPYEDSAGRRGGEYRAVFQKKIADDLLSRGIPFIELRGSIERRIEKVKECIANCDISR